MTEQEQLKRDVFLAFLSAVLPQSTISQYDFANTDAEVKRHRENNTRGFLAFAQQFAEEAAAEFYHGRRAQLAEYAEVSRAFADFLTNGAKP